MTEGHTRRARAASPMTTETIGTGSRPREPDHPGQSRGCLCGIVARPGIEPWRIDQGNDRQLEVTGQA